MDAVVDFINKIGNIGGIIGIGSVSYTHLDVYKRQAYFYKMMIRFWKMALLIEKEHGFLEVSGQSEYARKFSDECPSLIAYYYPDKLSETKLNSYLSELSKGVETC